MMHSSLPHSDEEFRKVVQQALKRYRKGADLMRHAAITWPATVAYMQSNRDPVASLRTVIEEALDILASTFATEAQILTEEYIEGKSVLDIVTKHILSESDFYRKRKRGIDELTIVLKILNREASTKRLTATVEKYDFKQQALVALLGSNLVRTISLLGQYPYPKAMASLVSYLNNLDLSSSDREIIIMQLHNVYNAAGGDEPRNVAARQFSLYILGTFASLESYPLLNQVWKKEPHPWPMRAALLASPSSAKYEEYLYRLSHDEQAREVARTFPRVFYGDQPPRAGLYLDDHKPRYAKTLQYYLSNYPRYLDEASLGLVLYVCHDLIITKGDNELRQQPKLKKMLQQVLEIEPLHPLGRREWNKLRLLSR